MNLSKEQILLIGAFGAGLLFVLSFWKWRLAVKVAIVAALFEGAIRKWGLPQAQELVYFLKDVFLAGAYVRFFLFPEPSLRRLQVNAPFTLFVVVGLIVALSALNPNIASIPAAVMGLKIYLYYIPMAFMMPYLFKDEKDVVRQLSWFALIAIPICLLGTLQFFSNRFSLLNVYAHEAGSIEQNAQGVHNVNVAYFGEGEFARITGTFSFISGMATYLIVVTGLTLALLTSPLVRFRVFLLAGVLPLTVANALMSGSRSAVIGQGIVILVMLLASFYIKTVTKAKGTMIVTVALAVAMIAVRLFFRDASEAYQQRTGSAEAREEMRGRIVQTVATLTQGFDEGGWTGLGIGLTHPATVALRGFIGAPWPPHPPPSIESEPSQILVELGLVGFTAWYVLRFSLIYLTFINFLRCRSGFFKNLHVVSLAFQLIHLQLQFIFNHTAQFLFWALYGITLIPFCTTFAFGRRPALADQGAPDRTSHPHRSDQPSPHRGRHA